MDTITVNSSPASEQLGQAVRTFLIAAGGYAAGQGWIDSSLAAASVPIIMIGLPLLWGQLVVRQTHSQRVTMADAVPNDLATVVK
jgi:uncharacterized membrane protein